jgi:hypothetical protein
MSISGSAEALGGGVADSVCRLDALLLALGWLTPTAGSAAAAVVLVVVAVAVGAAFDRSVLGRGLAWPYGMAAQCAAKVCRAWRLQCQQSIQQNKAIFTEIAL